MTTEQLMQAMKDQVKRYADLIRALTLARFAERTSLKEVTDWVDSQPSVNLQTGLAVHEAQAPAWKRYREAQIEWIRALKAFDDFILERPTVFDVARHNDPTYVPPSPWTVWDSYAGCWTCRRCGAAAGFQIHNPRCSEAVSPPTPVDLVDRGCGECYGCVTGRTCTERKR